MTSTILVVDLRCDECGQAWYEIVRESERTFAQCPHGCTGFSITGFASETVPVERGWPVDADGGHWPLSLKDLPR